MKKATFVMALAALLMAAITTGVSAGLIDGLAAYYPLEDGSGVTAGDEIGTNDGTLQGTIAWASGKIGGGVALTRTATTTSYTAPTGVGFIEVDSLTGGVGAGGLLNDTDSYTFNAWAQLDPVGSVPWGYAIWGANTAANQNGNVMRIGASKLADGLFARTTHPVGPNNVVDWSDGQWHMVTLALGPDGKADYYIDGAIYQTKAGDAGLDREKLWSTAGLFHFGMEMEGNLATDGWNGGLDELAIWNS